MTEGRGIFKTYSKGHTFYISSDCPVCPVCEKENNPDDGFLSEIGAPEDMFSNVKEL